MNDYQKLKYGYRHVFRVKFTYKDKLGRELFSILRNIYLSKLETIDDHRFIKKAMCSETNFSQDKAFKNLLCNGKLQFEPICYQGFMKSKSHKSNLSFSSIPLFKK